MWVSCILWPSVSHETNHVITWDCSHLEVPLGGDSVLELARAVVGRIQLLTGCWLKAPSVSSHMGFSVGQLTTWRLTLSEQTSEKARDGV